MVVFLLKTLPREIYLFVYCRPWTPPNLRSDPDRPSFRQPSPETRVLPRLPLTSSDQSPNPKAAALLPTSPPRAPSSVPWNFPQSLLTDSPDPPLLQPNRFSNCSLNDIFKAQRWSLLYSKAVIGFPFSLKACDPYTIHLHAIRPSGLPDFTPDNPRCVLHGPAPLAILFPKCVVTGDTLPRPECSQDSLQLPLRDAWLTPAPPSGLGLETSPRRTGSLTAPPHSQDSLPDEHG